jgi:hypothetical protein
MDNKIREAIQLLKENNYVVVKMTKQMQGDADECERQGFQGDCLGCSCSICVIQ